MWHVFYPIYINVAPMEKFMKNIKWISIPLEELAKQCNSTISFIKEKMSEKDIPIIEQGKKEAIAKKYVPDLLS
jgi:hypothetical protein